MFCNTWNFCYNFEFVDNFLCTIIHEMIFEFVNVFFWNWRSKIEVLSDRSSTSEYQTCVTFGPMLLLSTTWSHRDRFLQIRTTFLAKRRFIYLCWKLSHWIIVFYITLSKHLIKKICRNTYMQKWNLQHSFKQCPKFRNILSALIFYIFYQCTLKN